MNVRWIHRLVVFGQVATPAKDQGGKSCSLPSPSVEPCTSIELSRSGPSTKLPLP